MGNHSHLPHPDRSQPSETGPGSACHNDQDQPSECHPAIHEPEIYDIEDLPRNAPERDSGARLVKPYAIEEPNEETASEPESDPKLPQRRQPRSWEDLVNLMEDLYCDSDHSNPGLMPTKRGRKRKPTNTSDMTDGSLSGQSFSTASLPDAQYERPSLSPKRSRKKEVRPKDVPASVRAAQRHRIRRHRALSGSSTTSISTDMSSANPANGSPVPDAMDLD
ncbi:uncharacterized protein BDV17DRAFT_138142 [Aspergillus undulatus]|uniref:uncharacterized protein n=1 Tax=Aspergillus undulatus TaxID=1810928 RepID=UPI003CCE53AB